MGTSKRGDQLVERILTTGGDDAAAMALLEEFFHGYPITNLYPLLQNSNEAVVKQAAWIASELGPSNAPLIDELPPLLSHSSRVVRFYVLDAILSGATKDHGAAIAGGVLSLRDPDEAVRRKALQLVARVTTEQLAHSVPYVDDTTLDMLLAWLLRLQDTPMDKDDVVTRLSDTDSLVRLFAAVAAARMSWFDPMPLISAASAQDPLLREFGKDEIEFTEHMAGRERRRAARILPDT